MARCGVPGIDLPIEPLGTALDCGCRRVWYGFPVNGYKRVWCSDCTDPEHTPASAKAIL